MIVRIIWKKKTKKNIIKLKELSFLNAWYIGLYQNMKEQGTKRAKYNNETPNVSAPLAPPLASKAVEQTKLKNNVKEYTKKQEKIRESVLYTLWYGTL